ncbi:MAG: hypothetical protein ACJAS4_003653 [Bacteriovoracaceae bacterium]|jgi:hypothetical protein
MIYFYLKVFSILIASGFVCGLLFRIYDYAYSRIFVECLHDNDLYVRLSCIVDDFLDFLAKAVGMFFHGVYYLIIFYFILQFSPLIDSYSGW